MIKIKCRHCGHVLECDTQDLRVEVLDKERRETVSYQECPECKSRMYIEFSNQYIQDKMHEARRDMSIMDDQMRHGQKIDPAMYRRTQTTMDKIRFTAEFLKLRAQKRYGDKYELCEVETVVEHEVS